MKNTSKLIAGLAVAIIAVALILISSHSGQNPAVSTSPTNESSPAVASQSPALSGAAYLSLLAPLTGTFDAGQTQTVKWTSTNYTPKTVQVALIRKVSDNPARYELVRMVAPATQNDGAATWVPSTKDLGKGLSIEVGCTFSPQACTASKATSQLAVVNDGRYANTASAFQAIEAADNK